MITQLRILTKRFAVIGLTSILLVGCIATEDDFAESISSENKLIKEGKQVTITFHSSDGDGAMQSIKVPAGAFMTLPQNNFTKEGEIFEGWSVTEYQIVTYLDNGIINAGDNNIELYAVWREALNYKVFFNSNEGLGSMQTLTVLEGSSIDLPANNYSRTDYYFSGWSIGENGGLTYADQEKLVMPSKNLELYVVWDLIPVYSIMYNANGGAGSMGSEFLKENESKIVATNTFTRTGYTFAGWSYDSNPAIELVDQGTIANPNQNITLYANWEPNKYVVSFNPSGGAGSMNDIPYGFGESISLPENTFSKIGYTFAGWATEAAGSVAYNNNTQLVANVISLSLHAVWTPIAYEITYHANGGSGSMTKQNYNYGTSTQLNANQYTHANLNFAGWSTTAEGNVEYLDQGNYSLEYQNIDLYAIWQNTVSVTQSVSAGYYNSFYVDNSGKLWATGQNTYGQLGLGDKVNRLTFTEVNINTVIKKVSAAQFHTLILDSSGQVFATGRNNYGQLGTGDTFDLTSFTKVFDNALDIAAGRYHSLILSAAKKVHVVGHNQYGQLGTGDSTHLYQLNEVAEYSNAMYVAAGKYNSFIILENKQLLAAGNNSDGHYGNGSTSNSKTFIPVANNTVLVDAAVDHTTSIQFNNSLYELFVSGDNNYAQLGSGNYTQNETFSKITFSDYSFQKTVAGATYSLALSDTGVAIGAGNSQYGQLGRSTGSTSFIQLETQVLDIAGGNYHTVLMKANGKLLVSGDNDYGQLGTGNTTGLKSYVEVVIGE